MITDYEGVLFLDSDTDDDRADNRPSRFHTFMHSLFRFDGEGFEVGLLEIQIPYTWVNLRDDQYIGAFDSNSCSGIHKISSGCYYNTVDLVSKINRKFGDLRDPPELIYDPLFNRIRSKAGSYTKRKEIHMIATKELADLLGMPYWLSTKAPPIVGQSYMLQQMKEQFGLVQEGKWPTAEMECLKTPVNLQAGMERLYISSSIVKHRAHHQHELLRVIPLNRVQNFGEIQIIRFDRPIFVPVAHATFDRIEICITDRQGREPIFTRGNVVVALEFRRRDG